MTETFDDEGALARQAATHTRTMGLTGAFEKGQVPKDFLYPEESAKCTATKQGVKTLLKESCRDIQRGVDDGSIPNMVLTLESRDGCSLGNIGKWSSFSGVLGVADRMTCGGWRGGVEYIKDKSKTHGIFSSSQVVLELAVVAYRFHWTRGGTRPTFLRDSDALASFASISCFRPNTSSQAFT